MRDLVPRRFKAFRVGPLPANLINRALGTDLEPADVWVSKACHRHIAEDHPADYPLILANIVAIICEPTWIGQDPRHRENFYVVRRIIADGEATPALVAIGLERSEHGTYNVKSAYSISEEDVDTRRLRGSLRAVHRM